MRACVFWNSDLADCTDFEKKRKILLLANVKRENSQAMLVFFFNDYTFVVPKSSFPAFYSTGFDSIYITISGQDCFSFTWVFCEFHLELLW